MGTKRICDQCGKECDEAFMEKFSPSPLHPKYICWDCFKKGQYEAAKSEIGRRNRLEKYWATGYKNK